MTRRNNNSNKSNEQCSVTSSRSTCPIANGLDILGDRWTLLIIRDLMFTNKCEFGHLMSSSEGISTNILSERLERLQCYGIIEKQPHPTHGKKFVYEMTARGRELAPMMFELVLWGQDSIAESDLPKYFIEAIKNNREALLETINAGEPLMTFDL